ncbi:family 20 glycosylhydrolase [Massilia sp. Se16.2.3]|uniref:family 20 glycosylhydrolase n=1 Tax=Massilia sp. Se16.2.3 TaxID=2709303 RepID=UPI002277196C|nr:family 20 glycosylhydrolase [Massilia sp. Se16.2.3]
MAEQGWQDVAELRADFVARCRAILAVHGLAFAGWDDTALLHPTPGGAEASNNPGAEPDPRFAGPGFQVYVWNNAWGSGQEDCAFKLANAGYEVVLANAANLYFDLAYAKDPQEPGYYWAGFVDTRQAFLFSPLDLTLLPGADQMGRPLSPMRWGGWYRWRRRSACSACRASCGARTRTRARASNTGGAPAAGIGRARLES